MSELRTLFLYGELGNLKICILPEEPFLTIPMVSAHKEGEELVFGNKALEKDESWQLVWLRNAYTQSKLFEPFLLFVFSRTKMEEAIGKCSIIFGTFKYVFSAWKVPRSMKGLLISVDRLSVAARNEFDIRYSLNIYADSSGMRCSNRDDGYPYHCSGCKVGFDTIVNLFMKLLCEKGYNFTGQRDRLFCQKLVMDYCYVALDFEKELAEIEDMEAPLHEITMEDGTILELGKECIIAPEVLFNPGLVGMDNRSCMSLFQKIGYVSLPHSPPLILTGGCASALNGLGERIQRELEAMDEKYIDEPVQFIKANVREDALRYVELFETLRLQRD